MTHVHLIGSPDRAVWGVARNGYEKYIGVQDNRLANLPGVLDIIPAYCSLSLVFDTPALLRAFPRESPFEYMCSIVEQQLHNQSENDVSQRRLLEIPVCYDLSLAPDLEVLASKKGPSTAEIINLHTSTALDLGWRAQWADSARSAGGDTAGWFTSKGRGWLWASVGFGCCGLDSSGRDGMAVCGRAIKVVNWFETWAE